MERGYFLPFFKSSLDIVAKSCDTIWDTLFHAHTSIRAKEKGEEISSPFLYQSNCRTLCVIKNPLSKFLWTVDHLVHFQGLEPWARWLRVSCSTNWARSAYHGDPWENRTPVCGVRGRRLDRLTNGPWRRSGVGTLLYYKRWEEICQ